ncbi:MULTISPECIES: DEAD/DEAH box helicase [unclassified Variovorax]|uniref:DEAD/DEAH box helicase n=1 Tax=unclassified Variovorax TaxID=663243 RepID=UPI0008BC6ED7|nr:MULTISPECIES: DEAD/DEAH box helicase [unclassified Variovorax]SEK14915.1 Helicase conserved C-terminal domain-containing protein [Variovorax sp. OK202]SFE06163.1 Helicase conserved C-terminal domain-containing protein [Variovorax sp. OK212]
MATTLEELQANIEAAVTPGFRQKLLARGQARGMIWRAGLLPIDAPHFSPELSEDLLSFGYSLLLHGLRYVDLGGNFSLARVAFEVAAESIEAVVSRGEVDENRDFHRLIAGGAYHLGRYSARAYSMLFEGLGQSNLSVVERCLAQLMLRDLEGVNAAVSNWFESGVGSDSSLIAALSISIDAEVDEQNDREGGVVEAMTLALEGNFLSAMSQTLLALERGEQSLILQAQARLREGLSVAGELNLVSQWWTHRLAVHIVDGLWASSFHVLLPIQGPAGADVGEWVHLRKLLIASLMRRRRAEIELWPSQIDAAKRVLEFDANLVLSLPTSAGKTRIAELCILACLARGKRVVFVTPLRALSAQTEGSLRRTFGPLGKTVSSLYGSIGASSSDVDALKSQDIVVSTPEKLDFALRSDPELLDDIGLVVLDEGHMIGLGEREVRYEAQIQRLLRRADAASRRIVCLSAILPDGDQLVDFTAWLTSDRKDGLIKNDWRPTRLRFGEVDWNPVSNLAQLKIVVGDEHPFVSKFVVGKTLTANKNAKVYPASQTDLCILSAWRLIEEGQSVLVFCPLRVSVVPFARRILEMIQQGLIVPMLAPPAEDLTSALAVGVEWFGPDHEILKCLRMGVAVHHGELPTSFRKEIERLLRDGVLKLTVSSPTLAQGLNLAATSLVFHGHARKGATIDVSEFRNVVGRAGRAYIDIEGLVLYPMFDNQEKRRTAWSSLIASKKGREMESGILQLLQSLLVRIARKLDASDVSAVLDYVAGQGGWDFPFLRSETGWRADESAAEWPRHLTSLDTTIFSLLGDAQVADEDIEATLDKVLASSLFMRRITRQDGLMQSLLIGGLKARVKFIWSNSTALQRRGYFLAGVGLASGQALDSKAEELEYLLLQANLAADEGEVEIAIQAIIGFADIVFEIPPFSPKKLPGNWKHILELWLRGVPVPYIGGDGPDDSVSLIEGAFIYNLPWAMEAVRVRAEVHQDLFSDDVTVANYGNARAVAAIETGTLSGAASTLIKAGFASRLGAIHAVAITAADFDSPAGMRAWLASPEVKAQRDNPSWPTVESHELWVDFTAPHGSGYTMPWSATIYTGPVTWHGVPMPPGTPLKLGGGLGKEDAIYTADFKEVGKIGYAFNRAAVGLSIASATGATNEISFEYIGPNDLAAL